MMCVHALAADHYHRFTEYFQSDASWMNATSTATVRNAGRGLSTGDAKVDVMLVAVW